MSSRLERAQLRHASTYLGLFLSIIDAYREGSESVEDLTVRMTDVLPQVTTAFTWCTNTERFQTEAKQIRKGFTDREDLTPEIGVRTAEESRRWANTIRQSVEQLRGDPNLDSFLGQFAAVTEADASIMIVREETRSELKNLLADMHQSTRE